MTARGYIERLMEWVAAASGHRAGVDSAAADSPSPTPLATSGATTGGRVQSPAAAAVAREEGAPVDQAATQQASPVAAAATVLRARIGAAAAALGGVDAVELAIAGAAAALVLVLAALCARRRAAARG